MRNRITIVAILVGFLAAEASAQNHTFRRRGVILGGLAGAALGVAIGDKGNNETAGALIGGAVGAIAGGTIGNQKDRRIEHDRRYHSGYQPYSQQYQGHSHQGHPHNGQSGTAYPNYHQPYYYPQETEVYSAPRPVILSPAPAPAPAPAEEVQVLEAPAFSSAPDRVSKEDVISMYRSGMSESLIIQQVQLHGVRRKLSVADVIELHEIGVSEPVISAMQTGVAPATSVPPPPAPGLSYRGGSPEGESFGPSIIAPAN